MLNKDGARELVYVVRVDDVKPIEGKDRVECAVVGGWQLMVPIHQFRPGSLGIYFEIDSKVDTSKPYFAFLEKRHGKIKTQKFKAGTGHFYSQGLLMAPEDFGWEIMAYDKGIDMKNGMILLEGDFLTKELGVVYADDADNKRKANSVDKYKKMASRHPKLFQNPLIKKLYKTSWGKRILFVFFGKKKDKAKAFPTHFPYIHKSDEERVENMPWILDSEEPWIKTLKIDGTSSTYILERKPFGRFEYYVLSRNVRQLDEKQETYHDFNVYWYNSKKFKIKEFLMDQMQKHPEWQYCCIQGESAGGNQSGSIQGNPHKLPDIFFFGFNFIDSENGRWNSVDALELCKKYNIPWVPIVDAEYYLPKTMEEMKLSADGPCDLDGSSGLREGFVYRSLDGKKSFKNVSREYLMKH